MPRPPGFFSRGPPRGGGRRPGKSATGRSRPRTIASASGEASRSSHVDTRRLRASTSSSRRVSGSNREPISVRPAPRRIGIGVPEQEGAQDEVVQAGVGGLGHYETQLHSGNAKDPPGRGGHHGQVGTLTGEHADLAQELGPAVPGDQPGAGLAVTLDGCRPQCRPTSRSGRKSRPRRRTTPRPGSHVALGAVPAQHLKLASLTGPGTARRGNQVFRAAITGLHRSSGAAPHHHGRLCPTHTAGRLQFHAGMKMRPIVSRRRAS